MCFFNEHYFQIIVVFFVTDFRLVGGSLVLQNLYYNFFVVQTHFVVQNPLHWPRRAGKSRFELVYARFRHYLEALYYKN